MKGIKSGESTDFNLLFIEVPFPFKKS